MKYYKLLLLIAVFALLTTAAQAIQVVPFTKFPVLNQSDLVQYAPFQMYQGWENGKAVWYIATDSSNQQIACETLSNMIRVWGLNYSPALANLAGQVAMAYVIVNSPATQGPVFTAVPGDPTYSGLWQLVYVTFKPGATKHAVTNAGPYDPVTNPTGLPSVADADFTTLINGKPVVVKFPIVAVGPLGGPWTPAIPGAYRIPQGKVETNYTYTKIIWLPFWQVYCRDSITKRVSVEFFVIPDAFDPPGVPLADQFVPKLRTNNAPGLGLINPALTQPFYYQVGIQPLSQYPVIHACSEYGYSPCQNINPDYIPVETVVVLQRNVPPLNPSAVLNNEPAILQQIINGNLTVVRSSQIINATQIEAIPQ